MKNKLVHAALGLFLLIGFTTSAYAGWTQTNWPTSTSYFKLYGSQSKVFAQTWDSLNGGRTFITSNGGANWTQIASADSNTDILSIVLVNSKILAGTWNGFYQSTTGGTSWNALTPTGLPADSAIPSVAMINGTLYAGMRGDVYKSSDTGTTWTEVKTGIPAGARITSFVASGSAIIAGSDTSGVFITTNSGTNWTAIDSGLTNRRITQLAVIGSKVFAVTLKGVFVSTNNGTSWAAYSSGPTGINCFVVARSQFIAGTDSNGAHYSTDSGLTWHNSMMPNGTRVWSLAVTGDSIYAGTNSGVWLTTTSQVTSLKNSESFHSTSPGLRFSRLSGSMATVAFVLPNPTVVALDMYDLRGNKVLSLAHNRCAAGQQSMSFDTRSVEPGLYIMRLTAGTAVYQQTVPILR